MLLRLVLLVGFAAIAAGTGEAESDEMGHAAILYPYDDETSK